jgi:hypothetical protein
VNFIHGFTLVCLIETILCGVGTLASVLSTFNFFHLECIHEQDLTKQGREKESYGKVSYAPTWNSEREELTKYGIEALNKIFGEDSQDAHEYIGKFEIIIDNILDWCSEPANISQDKREQWEEGKNDLLNLINDIIKILEPENQG